MRLIVCIAVCLGAAGLGSLLTTPSLRPWYAGLSKPRWTPPNWLFGPVWTILFIAMAIAAWLVWRKVGLTAAPMQLFLLQLLLNVAWSALFFRLRSPGLASPKLSFCGSPSWQHRSNSGKQFRPQAGCCCHTWYGLAMRRRSIFQYGG